jgi:hypothetical protein
MSPRPPDPTFCTEIQSMPTHPFYFNFPPTLSSFPSEFPSTTLYAFLTAVTNTCYIHQSNPPCFNHAQLCGIRCSLFSFPLQKLSKHRSYPNYEYALITRSPVLGLSLCAEEAQKYISLVTKVWFGLNGTGERLL